MFAKKELHNCLESIQRYSILMGLDMLGNCHISQKLIVYYGGPLVPYEKKTIYRPDDIKPTNSLGRYTISSGRYTNLSRRYTKSSGRNINSSL